MPHPCPPPTEVVVAPPLQPLKQRQKRRAIRGVDGRLTGRNEAGMKRRSGVPTLYLPVYTRSPYKSVSSYGFLFRARGDRSQTGGPLGGPLTTT